MIRDEYAAAARDAPHRRGGRPLDGGCTRLLACRGDGRGRRAALRADALRAGADAGRREYGAPLVAAHALCERGRSAVDPRPRGRSETMIAYGCSTRRSLEAVEYIARGTVVRLGFVSAPTLVIQSEEDNRLPREQSDARDRPPRCEGPHRGLDARAPDTCSRWTRLGTPRSLPTSVAWLRARFPDRRVSPGLSSQRRSAGEPARGPALARATPGLVQRFIREHEGAPVHRGPSARAGASRCVAVSTAKASSASSGSMCTGRMNQRGSYAPTGRRISVAASESARDLLEVGVMPRVAGEVDVPIADRERPAAPERAIAVEEACARRSARRART